MRHTPILIALLAFMLTSCLKNDAPYPIVQAEIQSMTVEYQCDESGTTETSSANINKTNRTIDLYVDDRADIRKVRVTRLDITNDATLSFPKGKASKSFPAKGFDAAPEGANTCVDFTNPVIFRLSTYQDYDWTVNVKQIIKREIIVEGQVGDAVVDEKTHMVLVHVSVASDRMSDLKIQSFKLAGLHGTITPNIDELGSYNFNKPVKLSVRHAYEDADTEWTVFVNNVGTEGGVQTATGSLFPWSTRAYVEGSAQVGATVAVEYKKKSDADWTAQTDLDFSGVHFETVLMHLEPSTDYVYRFVTNGAPGEQKPFTTAPATPLTGGDFDNWHSTEGASHKDLWNPWAKGDQQFWDTGNRGATTVGGSNSVPTDETCNGRGKAALLESKYIVIKFAAGNMFTGSYKKTDGTNGILDFGRPFKGFPTKLRVNYKYTTSKITRSADPDYDYLKGRPDSCQIYIALADWDKPYELRTNPRHELGRALFSPKLPGVIAYAQITVGSDVTDWKQQDLELEYYDKKRTPNHILIVCSSSKYGDFFAGGEGSKLWIDNFELIYD